MQGGFEGWRVNKGDEGEETWWMGFIYLYEQRNFLQLL
jgi:hypothetical protein